ncbi:MAG: LptF/LptG family permease [Planctomycetaceae bacterium]|nr:LptF/LptG family permease [Planctomycetaceae bacterium]
MVRTLHKYIGRDLLKVAVLALVVSTLLFTVFTVVEPLRKLGLASAQVAEFIFYTIPIMLSMTLPVAALFASTIVYGRFSQDNEMTACRASGLSTLNVLSPALALGVTVALLSLVLSNFVTPRMAELVQKRVKDNMMALISKKLETQGYFEQGKSLIVHADTVARDSEQGMVLYGVVAINIKRPKDDKKTPGAVKEPDEIIGVTASKAHASFGESDDVVDIHLVDPMAFRTRDGSDANEALQPWRFEMPNRVKDDPSWYDWWRLMQAQKKVYANAEIRSIIEQIRSEMVHDMFIDVIMKNLESGGVYRGLSAGEDTFWIKAPLAKRDPGKGVDLSSQVRPDGLTPITVTVMRGGTWHERITATTGRIAMGVPPLSTRSVVSITLSGEVESQLSGSSQLSRHNRRSFGNMSIPASTLKEVEDIGDATIANGDPKVVRSGSRHVASLKKKLHSVRSKITAEIHRRLAMACSCFILVAMGAAMGLLLRGGQILTAFVITAVLGSVMLILVIRGTQMISDTGINSTAVGLGLAWGSVAGMTLATAAVLVNLCRR